MFVWNILWLEDQFDEVSKNVIPWLIDQLAEFAKNQGVKDYKLNINSIGDSEKVLRNNFLCANFLHSMRQSDLVLLDLNFDDYQAQREFGWDVLIGIHEHFSELASSLENHLPPIVLFSGIDLQEQYQPEIEELLDAPFLTEILNKKRIQQYLSLSQRKKLPNAAQKWATKKLSEQIQVSMQQAWNRYKSGAVGITIDDDSIDKLIGQITNEPVDVFVTGESGTGKEMVARKVCQAMELDESKFVAVNCGAIPPNLFEAEFFGWIEGAHSTAMQERMGYFEQAHEGILFLDEIAELGLSEQTKLLRVLQERKVRRLGESNNINRDVNFRLICATNKDLRTEVREGRFREDLFFRLFTKIRIDLKPLHLRPKQAAETIIRNIFSDLTAKEKYNKPWLAISDELISHLCEGPVTGNIRGIAAVMETMIALADPQLHKILTPELIPDHCQWLIKGEEV
jgi:DNA-binding NtrC family response regulator